MKGVIWTGSALEPTDALALRRPEADEVVVEIAAAGLCHSDLNPIEGRYEQPVPAVLGHEAVGRIVDAGVSARDNVGRRVVLTPIASCGVCRNCKRALPTACLDEPPPRPTPFSVAGEPVHQFVRIGAFAERTIVPARQTIPIPNDIPDTSAALFGCAVITGAGAIARAGVNPGDIVLVTGAGGIGLNAVQAARGHGAGDVLVVDRNPSKRRIATTMGASRFVHTPAVDDIGAAVRSHAPSGVDVAIETTGSPAVLSTAIDSMARGGRCVVVGLPGADDAVQLVVRTLFHDRAVLGSRMGSADPQQLIPRLTAAYTTGELDVDTLVTRVEPLDRINVMVDALRNGELDRGVLRIP